jgi:hypothetical protein
MLKIKMHRPRLSRPLSSAPSRADFYLPPQGQVIHLIFNKKYFSRKNRFAKLLTAVSSFAMLRS